MHRLPTFGDLVIEEREALRKRDVMTTEYDAIRVKLLNAIDKAFDGDEHVDVMYVKTLIEALVTLDTVTLMTSP